MHTRGIRTRGHLATCRWHVATRGGLRRPKGLAARRSAGRISYSVPRRRGLRIVRDGVFFFKANAVFHSLRRSSFQNQNRTAASCLVDNFGIPLCWVLILYREAALCIPGIRTRGQKPLRAGLFRLRNNPLRPTIRFCTCAFVPLSFFLFISPIDRQAPQPL